MLVEEKKGADRIIHYSDAGKYIKQTESGALMLFAEDVYPCPYVYTETDETPEEPQPDPEEVINIITGVEE